MPDLGAYNEQIAEGIKDYLVKERDRLKDELEKLQAMCNVMFDAGMAYKKERDEARRLAKKFRDDYCEVTGECNHVDLPWEAGK
jgi:predicted nuclease with TOPRIM domain